MLRLQVKAQWTVAQQDAKDPVLHVDCLMIGERLGSLQLTAKACPALPRLVQAMDSMQADASAVAVAALACSLDAAKAVLRKSEHLLPPSSSFRLLVAALLLTGWCTLLQGPAARPCTCMQGTCSLCLTLSMAAAS